MDTTPLTPKQIATYGGKQLSRLRTLGYSEAEIAAMCNEADELLAGARQRPVSSFRPAMTAKEALDMALSMEREQGIELPPELRPPPGYVACAPSRQRMRAPLSLVSAIALSRAGD